MDRSKLADLSEIVSSVAIVITLVYLAVEMRQNTDALRAQTSQAVLTASQSELAFLVERPDLGLLMAQPDLVVSPAEHIQLDAYLTLSWRSREFAWMQFREGAIDDSQWATELAVLRTLLDSRTARVWWQNAGRYAFGADYVAFVDQIVSENALRPEVWAAYTDWSETPAEAGR